MVHWVSVYLLTVGVLKYVNSSYRLYDQNLYQSVLDNVTCQRHLEEIELFEFFDASGRIPQSIRLGGQLSLGNYRQCLSIVQHVHESVHDVITGKYCMIAIPLNQTTPALVSRANSKLNKTFFELINMSVNATENDNGTLRRTVGRMMGHTNLRVIHNNVKKTRHMSEPQGVYDLEVKVGICIPRSCTTHQAFGRYVEKLNVSYRDEYCRLPGDKILSTPEYVAVITITILGILTVLSSSYDLYNAHVLGKVPAETSKLLTSFSIFTNTRRLLSFPYNPDTIECLDGLRSLSLLWIVLGHAFSNKFFLGMSINLFEAYMWGSSSQSTWIKSAVLSVDTFFMISGILVVHTTVRKMTHTSLLKNLHLFYLHRLLRTFPLLAAAVLFQAAVMQHVADGPAWPALEERIQMCRDWWWSALLHVQNYFNSYDICITPTWYLSVDTQLHMLSPLVLFWVLRGGHFAWYGLATGLLTSISFTTIYILIRNYVDQSWLSFWDDDGLSKRFCYKEYFNTLTRSQPFFVGMMLGYLLYVWREHPRRIPKWLVGGGWLVTLVLGTAMVHINDPEVETDQDHGRFLTTFVQAFMRGLWALAVGWVVFACDTGYGGPINWFLSLPIWKFLARISYAVYLIHYPLQAVTRLQSGVPFVFSVTTVFLLFCSDISLSLTVATALCVLVDAPFSTLEKILLQGKLESTGLAPSIKKETMIF